MTVEKPNWMNKAPCKGVVDMFVLPMDPELPPGAPQNEFWERARRICMKCPVRIDCLRYAMEEVPSTDVAMWAGLSPYRRKHESLEYRRRHGLLEPAA